MDSQAPLMKIPLEILLLITSYLPTTALGSLRRTCKHIEMSLFKTFSKEFFTKKQFMLSEESLQALIDISNHPRLSHCLNHVIIGLDNYDNGRTAISEPEGASAYRAGLANQFTLLSTGQHRDMLTQAFQNLPNLQTVGLRDFNSRTRFRDDCEWTSYGATTIFRETGIRLVGNRMLATEEHIRFASQAFCTILYALGQSGAAPQAFEVLLRQRRSGLHDYAFNVPKYFEHSVEPVLSNLRTLLLALNLSIEPIFSPVRSDDSITDNERPDYLLKQFLCHTPNLNHLRLNFQSAHPSHAEQFIAWLSRPVAQADSLDTSPGSPLPGVVNPIALSQLRRLDLGIVRLSPWTLLAAIHKFKSTLRALGLWKITFNPEDQQRLYERKANVWAEFFAQLSNLDYVAIGYLAQMLLNQIYVIKFKSTANQSGEMSSVKEFSGYDMRQFPDNVVSDIVVVWPQIISDHEDESMSEVHDDESGTDDDIEA
ncbi:hypothetical protein AOQ84DRAFT_435807 [Glonium stellatum]|uniref:F-box domain-containing protein n=1 Tax=Glonium stellatum TaxID=574774 RepID=A0A8E2FCR6_9PEZI|nr:hypothetical protein AOQ84DRAFT_435807 [Glonium stellatum]